MERLLKSTKIHLCHCSGSLAARRWATSGLLLLVCLHLLEEFPDVLFPDHLLILCKLAQVLHQVVLHGVVGADGLDLADPVHLAQGLQTFLHGPLAWALRLLGLGARRGKK